MKFQKSLIAAALLGCACAAHAGDFYITGDVGSSHTSVNQGKVDSNLGALGATSLSSSASDNGTALRIGAGYRIMPNWAIEASYLDFGTFAKYDANFIQAGSAASVGVKIKGDGLQVAMIGTFPVAADWSLYGKVGVINAHVKSTVSASASSKIPSSDQSTTDLRPTIGLGGVYNINTNVGVRVGFERLDQIGSSQTGGKGNVDLFSLGLTYKF